MKKHPLTGAAVALLTMTAIPAWAACHDTSSVREPDSSAQVESNADSDVGTEDGHLRAEEVPVENLDEHQATEGNEDPAPEGYTTNVPADQIQDDADVGETTPETSIAESEDREDELAAEAQNGGSEPKAMKTEVTADGELTEADEQVSMSEAEEATEKVAELTEETVPGENGQVEAATGGAEPTENWFGCNPDDEQTEGETCEESQVEASPDEETGAEEEPQDFATLETDAKREVNLDVDCEDQPAIDGQS